MNEGFTSNLASMQFLRKITFKNFGGGEQKRAKVALAVAKRRTPDT